MHLVSLECAGGPEKEEWALTLELPADVIAASPDQPPAVHITSTAVEVKGTAGDARGIFDFPAECAPVEDPAAVRCKFRRKRRQLVLSWPAAPATARGAAALPAAEGGAAPAAAGAAREPSWPAEAEPLARLSDALRRFCRRPSGALWHEVLQLWGAAGELQAPYAAGLELDDAGCRWLHVPAGDLQEDRGDLPAAGLPDGELEAAADAEFESWASAPSRPPAHPPWLSPPGPPGRGAEALAGSRCEEVEARCLDAACLEQLRHYLQPASQRPVVLRGLADAVFPTGRAWHFRHLERHIGGAPVGSVRRSDGGTAVFDYADEHLGAKCAEIGSPWADPTVERLRDEMTFREFLRRARAAGPEGCDRYFWATLFEHSQDSDYLVGSQLASLLESDVSQIQWSALDALAEVGGFGSACCAQLFCSGVGAVSSFHYDMVQNVFLHLCGTKKFILLPPLLGAQALAPFPTGHPRDRSARVRLGGADSSDWPHAARARGAAVEAVLGPGDGLFLPLGWWHHVASVEKENISVNFWFGGGVVSARPAGNMSPPRPLPDAGQLELLRAAERFLTLTLGYHDFVPFLEWLQRPQAVLTNELPPPGQEVLWLQCANFVLFSAACLVPPVGLAGWLRALDVRRFLGL